MKESGTLRIWKYCYHCLFVSPRVHLVVVETLDMQVPLVSRYGCCWLVSGGTECNFWAPCVVCGVVCVRACVARVILEMKETLDCLVTLDSRAQVVPRVSMAAPELRDSR